MRLGISSYTFGWAVGAAGQAPARPLDEAGLREKFTLMSKRFDRSDMERLYQRLQNLENERTLEWLTA